MSRCIVARLEIGSPHKFRRGGKKSLDKPLNLRLELIEHRIHFALVGVRGSARAQRQDPAGTIEPSAEGVRFSPAPPTSASWTVAKRFATPCI